jgi:hypothetical protein
MYITYCTNSYSFVSTLYMRTYNYSSVFSD